MVNVKTARATAPRIWTVPMKRAASLGGVWPGLANVLVTRIVMEGHVRSASAWHSSENVGETRSVVMMRVASSALVKGASVSASRTRPAGMDVVASLGDVSMALVSAATTKDVSRVRSASTGDAPERRRMLMQASREGSDSVGRGLSPGTVAWIEKTRFTKHACL